MLRLYNTLSRSIQDFKPLSSSHVGMYTCGPTVYDHMHIGNLRTFVFSDILRRVLEFNNYNVIAVQNITDIDDKIIKRAKERNTSLEVISEQYTDLFLADIAKLHILKNTHQPKATEYIDKMVEYIQVLLEKELAYKEEDGSVYFDISKFPDYGKLSRIDTKNLKTGTRMLSDEYTKDDVQDFALWKAEKEGELGSYPSNLGWGRPGWHIECSVMSQELLGDTLDIHGGGIDLIFPHHENEIAQSEGKSGKEFVKYFVHGAHMLVDGKKMSKSLGNFYTLSDLEKKARLDSRPLRREASQSRQGFDPIALRYLYLQTHYRQEMNFTWEALEGAQNALRKLRSEISDWKKGGKGVSDFEQKFTNAINDDLNMPQALAIMWELLKSDNSDEMKAVSLFKFDKVLGLNLVQSSKIKVAREDIPENVHTLADERRKLRSEKKFEEADRVRQQLQEMGYEVQDSDDGKTIIKKS